MPYNNFISDKWKDVDIFALDGYLINVEDKSKTGEGLKNIEVGTKEELKKKIPEYKSSWNTDRKDDKVWEFNLRFLGTQPQYTQDSISRAQRLKENYEAFDIGNHNVIDMVIDEKFPEYKDAISFEDIPDEVWEEVYGILKAKYEQLSKRPDPYIGIPERISRFFGLTIWDSAIKDSEEERKIDKEFKEFAQDVFGAKEVMKEGTHQYYMYVPGKLTKAEFDEGMKEICERLGCVYELIDQAPEAPSRQYFSENMKLMYPDVKSYEVLLRNPRKFEFAKELFKKSWEQEFNPDSEDDREDLVLLYNEYMEELREWKPVEVKLIFEK